MVGGIILTELSFNFLFAIVGGILSLSLIPLILSKDYSCKKKDRGLKVVAEHLKYYGAYFAQGIIAVTTFFVIPFFTLFLMKSYISVGSITTLLLIGSFFVVIVVGRLTDKFEGKHLMRIGGVVLSASLIVLAYTRSPVVVYAASFMVGIGIVMIYLPLFAITSIISKKYNETEFMMLREVFIGAGSTLFAVALILLPNGMKIKAGLLAAALASVYFVFFR